jgi:hypothetical protein
MPFQPNQTGAQQGPAPWWQQSKINPVANLEQQAPKGYTYDAVQMKYTRTPESVGAAAGQAIKALQGQVPGMFAPNTSGSFGAGFGSGGSGGPGGGMPSIPNIPAIQMPDTSAAQAAAFARAKDQAGQTARGALTGLQSSMAGRGMLGSGLEGRGTAQVVNQGQQELGNVTREHAIQNASNAQKAAELAYQGGITQRGQDINMAQSQAEMALKKWQIEQEMRMKEAQMQQSASQSQSQSLSGLLGALNPQWY